ncbi:MAG: right-handed parallel beta-helix repeat-containing protein, partial [Prevotella sp.]|nr:right-handed parallel beta-helix repeat-containing protein [Candidatus Prevotella equi]
LLPSIVSAKHIINIDTQSTFDSIPLLLTQQLKSGETEIDISIAGKQFCFNENHVSLKGLRYPDTRISIHGTEGTIIRSGGMSYTKGDTYKFGYNHQNTFLNNKNQELSLWSDTRTASDTIQILNRDSKQCFIPFKGLQPQTSDMCKYTYVLITMWYTSSIYKVERITETGIYFTCSDLAFNSHFKCYNVNLDNGYLSLVKKERCTPRFRLCNSIDSPNTIADGYVSTESQRILECRYSTFLSIDDCEFRAITVENITFTGNAKNYHESALINCRNTTMEDGLHISNNTFRHLKSYAVYITATDDVTFSNNEVEDCASGILKSCNNCSNTIVSDNTFRRCGTGMTNIPVIQTCGTDYWVKGNVFEDFGYTAVNSGVHFTEEMTYPCRGVIEDNEMYYANTLSHVSASTLMDSGAIYVATQNDNTIIRNNYIHDYIGICDYRGIYCDDGANNCHVIGNTVRNTPTSYSIQFSPYGRANDKNNKSPYFCKGNTHNNNDCDGEIYLKP